jgi:peptidoglycan/xylan/chitin deacetylase (PgdA/CDA1 family)
MRLRSASMIWAFHDVADAAWFERCIEEISSVRRVVPLTELATKPSSRNSCAITFDDGRKSVFDVARPVLGDRMLPYTVFVCTEVLTGGPVPWFMRAANLINHLGTLRVSQHWDLTQRKWHGKRDLIIALKEIPLASILKGLSVLEEQNGVTSPDPRSLFVSVEDLKVLASSGAVIGAHTHRHPILSRLSAEEQRFEVEESTKVIHSFTGIWPTAFAYPNGTPLDFDATTMAIIRRSGFRLAVTTSPKYLNSRDDPLALPRIGLDQNDFPARRFVKTVAPWLSINRRKEQWRRGL